eukprot:14864439-Ditylum_brightwellii.AAC.1
MAAFGLRSDCVVICVDAHTQIKNPKSLFSLKGRLYSGTDRNLPDHPPGHTSRREDDMLKQT